MGWEGKAGGRDLGEGREFIRAGQGYLLIIVRLTP